MDPSDLWNFELVHCNNYTPEKSSSMKGGGEKHLNMWNIWEGDFLDVGKHNVKQYKSWQSIKAPAKNVAI